MLINIKIFIIAVKIINICDTTMSYRKVVKMDIIITALFAGASIALGVALDLYLKEVMKGEEVREHRE